MVASSETPCQSYRGVQGAVRARTSSSASSTPDDATASSIWEAGIVLGRLGSFRDVPEVCELLSDYPLDGLSAVGSRAS